MAPGELSTFEASSGRRFGEWRIACFRYLVWRDPLADHAIYRINNGDIILISLRDFQDEKGDVLMKYSSDEARNLKAYGELPETAKINEADTFGDMGEDNVGFEFDEDRDDSSDDEI